MAPKPHFPYRVEVLGNQHDRAAFSCGVAALDQYFRAQAGQDVRRRIATCFVLVASDRGDVAGYYTLAATSISLTDLPAQMAKKLPRYPVIPATLLGRLAVDQALQGRHFGEFLLMDAFSRCLRADIASFAFIVDAKDDDAQAFYERFGLRPLSAGERRLFLPMSEIAMLFS